MAALIATNLGILVLTFLPPILWLLFYLQEDRSQPEPKKLIALTFVWGMCSAILALLFECAYINVLKSSCTNSTALLLSNPLILFLGIALIEEYLKYVPVKYFILRNPSFDEPIDAIIYMMTSALGFAALENVLFLFPVFHKSLQMGFDVTAERFLGANLLHALASGIVGYFIARAYTLPGRKFLIGIGIIVATLLHTAFNYLILMRDVIPGEGAFYLIILLGVMAMAVFLDFTKLKKIKINLIH